MSSIWVFYDVKVYFKYLQSVKITIVFFNMSPLQTLTNKTPARK